MSRLISLTKSLKISNGKSEAVIRRTVNAMTESKRTNIDLQSTNHKTKDRVKRTTRKIGDELKYSGRVSSSCSTCGTHRVILHISDFYFRTVLKASRMIHLWTQLVHISFRTVVPPNCETKFHLCTPRIR